MDRSLARWLALREPVDAMARAVPICDAAIEAVAHVVPAHDACRVLDLGTGAGSNLRHLIDRLPSRQEWVVVDRSPTLLAHLIERTAAWGASRGYRAQTAPDGLTLSGDQLDCVVRVRTQDLSHLEAALFEGRHLVTCSALLDLVSATWVDRLARLCRARDAVALFALTYDGRSISVPGEPGDRQVLDLFNRHQRTDKGLGGIAAGPDAATETVRSFENQGYQVVSAASDWQLEPGGLELQRTLIEGWAAAAVEIDGTTAATIDAWLARRLAHLEAGRSQITVGHQDVAAWRSQRS